MHVDEVWKEQSSVDWNGKKRTSWKSLLKLTRSIWNIGLCIGCLWEMKYILCEYLFTTSHFETYFEILMRESDINQYALS